MPCSGCLCPLNPWQQGKLGFTISLIILTTYATELLYDPFPSHVLFLLAFYVADLGSLAFYGSVQPGH